MSRNPFQEATYEAVDRPEHEGVKVYVPFLENPAHAVEPDYFLLSVLLRGSKEGTEEAARTLTQVRAQLTDIIEDEKRKSAQPSKQAKMSSFYDETFDGKAFGQYLGQLLGWHLHMRLRDAFKVAGQNPDDVSEDDRVASAWELLKQEGRNLIRWHTEAREKMAQVLAKQDKKRGDYLKTVKSLYAFRDPASVQEKSAVEGLRAEDEAEKESLLDRNAFPTLEEVRKDYGKDYLPGAAADFFAESGGTPKGVMDRLLKRFQKDEWGNLREVRDTGCVVEVAAGFLAATDPRFVAGLKSYRSKSGEEEKGVVVCDEAGRPASVEYPRWSETIKAGHIGQRPLPEVIALQTAIAVWRYGYAHEITVKDVQAFYRWLQKDRDESEGQNPESAGPFAKKKLEKGKAIEKKKAGEMMKEWQELLPAAQCPWMHLGKPSEYKVSAVSGHAELVVVWHHALRAANACIIADLSDKACLRFQTRHCYDFESREAWLIRGEPAGADSTEVYLKTEEGQTEVLCLRDTDGRKTAKIKEPGAAPIEMLRERCCKEALKSSDGSPAPFTRLLTPEEFEWFAAQGRGAIQALAGLTEAEVKDPSCLRAFVTPVEFKKPETFAPVDPVATEKMPPRLSPFSFEPLSREERKELAFLALPSLAKRKTVADTSYELMEWHATQDPGLHEENEFAFLLGAPPADAARLRDDLLVSPGAFATQNDAFGEWARFTLAAARFKTAEPAELARHAEFYRCAQRFLSEEISLEEAMADKVFENKAETLYMKAYFLEDSSHTSLEQAEKIPDFAWINALHYYKGLPGDCVRINQAAEALVQIIRDWGKGSRAEAQQKRLRRITERIEQVVETEEVGSQTDSRGVDRLEEMSRECEKAFRAAVDENFLRGLVKKAVQNIQAVVKVYDPCAIVLSGLPPEPDEMFGVMVADNRLWPILKKRLSAMSPRHFELFFRAINLRRFLETTIGKVEYNGDLALLRLMELYDTLAKDMDENESKCLLLMHGFGFWKTAGKKPSKKRDGYESWDEFLNHFAGKPKAYARALAVYYRWASSAGPAAEADVASPGDEEEGEIDETEEEFEDRMAGKSEEAFERSNEAHNLGVENFGEDWEVLDGKKGKAYHTKWTREMLEALGEVEEEKDEI